MKRYTISKARERLADVLNEADRSGSVVIERGDAQYVITSRRRSRISGGRKAMIEILDPVVGEGQWTWALMPKGLRFQPRSRRRP